jgi:peptide/nickel transport system ATP-binding protein
MQTNEISDEKKQNGSPLVRIRSLHTVFSLRSGDVYAVNGLDFDLMEKERLALVGESGCGKSVLAQTIFRLLPKNARVSGEIRINGKDLFAMSREEMEFLRGREIGLIPQHLSSLDPLMKIGGQVREAYAPHSGLFEKNTVIDRVKGLLRSVNLDGGISTRYPHELSGGMNRRTLISMGIAQGPPLLIADEPTTGLDTIIRAKIVALIDRITRGHSLILITHDINTAKICEQIAVMYAGEIVEKGKMEDILNTPRHPYTRGLIASMPSRGMNQIPGQTPSLINIPPGCRFHPRCPDARDICTYMHPSLSDIEWGVRCHHVIS